MTESVGFVGLGQMGSRMAARIVQSGAQVVVYDLDAGAVARLTAAGALAAANPAEVASRAAIVLCSLPNPDVVETVLFGKDGIVAGDTVKTLVDLSTTGAAKVEKFAKRLAEHGIILVDAPVSGGVEGAAAGTLSIMVSGNPQALAEVDPYLRVLGKNIFVMGDAPGLGQRMKLVNNMLVAANAVAAFETLVLGVKAGLDATRMVEVINASSGRSFITTDKVPQCVLPRTFPQRFATELLYKDVKLGIEEAATVGTRLWMMEAALRLMALAMEEGNPKADYAKLIRYFEARAGVEVKGVVE